jgi:hypothetical protein
MFTPANDFGFSADNFGATYTDAGIGTGITSGAANTKGSTVSLLAGASVTEDVYGVAVGFSGGNAAATVRQYLSDLFIDPAGGTSWQASPIIPDLISNSPSLLNGGYWYYFPLFVKSGSAFGSRTQCSAASAALRVMLRLFGKPNKPELCKTGAFVRSFGVTAASSNGTTITPGTSAMGSYTASLGTTSDDLWWWQCGHATNDTTQTAVGYLLDVDAGDATNKYKCAQHVLVSQNNTAEQNGKAAFGLVPPIRHMKSGANIYMRAACSGTPDSSITVAAYGLGG